jgi:hypothetical protein
MMLKAGDRQQWNFLSLALLALVFWMCLPSGHAAAAGPPVDAIIRNQASASMKLPGDPDYYTVYSNLVEVRVSAFEALTLDTDNRRLAVAGSLVYFPHVLVNTGNVPSTYVFSVEAIGGDLTLGEFRLLLDRNGNGLVDPGDDEIALDDPSLTLVAGAAANLIVEALVPELAGADDSGRLTLTAETVVQAASASNTDTAVVYEGASFTISKAADTATTTGGGVINYQLRADNVSAVTATATDGAGDGSGLHTITIDGAAVPVVLLRDVIPANTKFVSGSLEAPAAGTRRLWRTAADPPFAYRSAEAADVIEVAVVATSVAPGALLALNFAVRVDDGASGRVDNRGVLHYDSGASDARNGYPTNLVPVTVTSVLGPDLTVTKGHAGNFTVDTEQQARLPVQSTGRATTEKITVTDTLPSGMTFVSAEGASWTCEAATTTGLTIVTCISDAVIDADTTAAPILLRVRVPASSLGGAPSRAFVNTAAVSGGGEPVVLAGNNDAADPTTVVARSSISGKVWFDANYDRRYQPGERGLPGWRVQLLQPTGLATRLRSKLASRLPPGMALVAEALTGGDGTYSFTVVDARDDYAVRFLSPDGYLYGSPVDGEDGTAVSGAVVDMDTATLTGITVPPGGVTPEQSMPVIPTGLVYDASSRLPVPGTVVRIEGPPGFDPARDLVGGADNVAQRTGADGFYQFLLTSQAPAGDYRLVVVVPSSYSGISTRIPPAGSALVVPAGVDPLAVQPQPAPPAAGASTTYYLTFRARADSRPVVNNHLPLDRGTSGTSQLLLAKSVSKTIVETVDLVDYALVLSNQSGGVLAGVSFADRPAAGFVYQAGSARLTREDGTSIRVEPRQIPNGRGGADLMFDLASVTMAADEVLRVTYRMRVNASALNGDGVNTATAIAGGLPSNQASARVKVVGGVFADEGFIIGKIFLDCNVNGVQDDLTDPARREIGIPGVRLYIEDGSFVITDAEGKYSFYGVRPLTHVLKVDSTTLPEGSVLGSAGNRNSIDSRATDALMRSRQAQTRFVDVKKGELHKADFVEQSCAEPVRAEIERRRKLVQALGDEGAAMVRRDFDPIGTLDDTLDVRSRPQTGWVDRATGMPSEALPDQGQGAASPGSAGQAAVPGAETLEQRMATVDAGLAILNLADGQILSIGQSPVMVKGAMGARFVLTINGHAIDESRVGKRSTVPATSAEGWEYIGVNFDPGENRVVLAQLDGFGNERGRVSITVIAPGQLDRIEVTLPERPIADGQTAVPVRIRLLDRNGVPFTPRTQVTIDTDIGSALVDDLSPVEPGVQFYIVGGQGTAPLRPPTMPGDGQVTIMAGNLRQMVPIVFAPELRPLIGAGIVEGVVSLGALDFSNMEPVRAGDAFERELRAYSTSFASGNGGAAGRAAFFLKGRIKGDFLLTAAYDSEKTVRDRLFRDIQPDEYYPVYGDSSERGFDAQSSGRLFVRIDKDASYLLYGDLTTQSIDEIRQITQYSRSLTGFKGHGETTLAGVPLQASGFAAHDNLRQVVEEFRANGTSGPFQLRYADLYGNTEQVTVLTRDRNQPALILKAEPKQRFVDYEIEPLTGRLLFKAPIPSLDSDLNPNSVRVLYEVDTGGPSFWVYGAEARAKPIDGLELGGLYIRDEDPSRGFSMYGAFGQYWFDAETSLIAEFAHTATGASLTDSVISLAGNRPYGNLLGAHAGDGMRVEFRHDGKDVDVLAQYSTSEIGFDNPSATVSAGRSELSAKVDWQAAPDVTVRGEARRSEDRANEGLREGISIGAEYRFDNNLRGEVGLRRYRESVTAAAADTIGVTPYNGTTGFGRLSVTAPDDPNLSGFVEYEQDVTDPGRQVAAVGSEYQLENWGRLYGRYEFLSSLGNLYTLNTDQKRYVGLFGFDLNYTENSSVFSEYRMNDAIPGRAAQAAIGLRNTFAIDDDWRLGATIERVEPVGSQKSLPADGYFYGGDYSGLDERSTAATLALEYLGSADLKGAGRLELRRSESLDSLLNTLAVAWKASDDWTLLARSGIQLDRGHSSVTGDATRYRQQVGAAYRPVADDEFNFITRYEHRFEELTGLATVFGDGPVIDAGSLLDGERRSEAHIVSAHANWQPVPDITLSGRYAVKYATERANDIDSHTWAQLLYGRVMWDIAENWDVGLQAFGLMGQDSAYQAGVGVEAGYMVTSDVWVSAGYNFTGFRDTDLAGEEPTDSGVYVRVRFKFDENSFGGEAGQ